MTKVEARAALWKAIVVWGESETASSSTLATAIDAFEAAVLDEVGGGDVRVSSEAWQAMNSAMIEQAATIVRLTEERDGWKATADQLDEDARAGGKT